MTPTTPAWAPEIEVILDRAHGLTQHEIWCLATAYRDPAFGEPEARRRLAGLAVRRAGSDPSWRKLCAAASTAVHAAAGPAEGALLKLALLFDAELAVADAALVALLPGRLSDEVRSRIAGPWRRITCA